MNKMSLQSIKQAVFRFERSDPGLSLRQILTSIVPYLLVWYAAYLSLDVSYWLTLLFTLVASGFLIRVFIVFHDCCHQSFFKNRRANDILGTLTGILTLYPYQKWKHQHTLHHATSGNLSKGDDGEIWIMTVDDYVKAPLLKRIGYRMYRNPFVMFVLGPFYTILLQNRFNRKQAKKKERLNTYLINAFIVAIAVTLSLVIGWKAFLLIQLPIVYFAGAAGIWLFYVQHQFEDTYFARDEEWDFVSAAVDGSSYYKLPKVLQWLTGNIGFHHVHHLSPKIPNYYLETVHNKTPFLNKVTTITLRSSLRAIRFRLWDENRKRFVGFREVKHLLNR